MGASGFLHRLTGTMDRFRRPIYILCAVVLAFAWFLKTDHGRLARVNRDLLRRPLPVAINGFALASQGVDVVETCGHMGARSATLVISVSDSCPVSRSALPHLKNLLGGIRWNDGHNVQIITLEGRSLATEVIADVKRLKAHYIFSAARSIPVFSITSGILDTPRVLLLDRESRVRMSIAAVELQSPESVSLVQARVREWAK